MVSGRWREEDSGVVVTLPNKYPLHLTRSALGQQTLHHFTWSLAQQVELEFGRGLQNKPRYLNHSKNLTWKPCSFFLLAAMGILLYGEIVYPNFECSRCFDLQSSPRCKSTRPTIIVAEQNPFVFLQLSHDWKSSSPRLGV